MAEEITKGLVKKKLEELEYPKNQDVYENSIILYKEDSYKKGKNRNQFCTFPYYHVFDVY